MRTSAEEDGGHPSPPNERPSKRKKKHHTPPTTFTNLFLLVRKKKEKITNLMSLPKKLQIYLARAAEYLKIRTIRRRGEAVSGLCD